MQSKSTQRPEPAAANKQQAQRWQSENREALESSNAFVEQNGLPLAKFRQF